MIAEFSRVYWEMDALSDLNSFSQKTLPPSVLGWETEFSNAPSNSASKTASSGVWGRLASLERLAETDLDLNFGILN